MAVLPEPWVLRVEYPLQVELEEAVGLDGADLGRGHVGQDGADELRLELVGLGVVGHQLAQDVLHGRRDY